MHIIAVITGKMISIVLKMFGKRGGSLPGKIAVKICPDLLKHFKYPKITVLVTGTNGKTSTTNMIAEIFAESGKNIATNSRGDNIINGIASLLIKSSNMRFEIKTDALILEVDELTLAKYLPMMDASDIVITNFFRDQLDRSGEMETIITKIGNALKDYKGRLFLNEDDPNVKRLSYVAKSAQIKSFGIQMSAESKTEDNKESSQNEAGEGKFCPICKASLVYDSRVYSHLGKYRCQNCEFSYEEPDFLAKDIDGEKMKVMSKYYFYSFDATYHVYNTLCTISVAKTYEIDDDIINEVTGSFSLGIGRMEKINVNAKTVLLNLVKNPTGANEIIKYIEKNAGKKTILILLNDNYADGTDVSWIWDVNFESLNNVQKVITTGKRAYDMALRFKLSEICDDIKVQKDLKSSVNEFLANEGCLYAISTYTGLFELRDMLLSFAKQN